MAIFLKAEWENLIMANYPVPSGLLTPFLPAGVELDLYQNKAWVSLVGFMFSNTKLFNLPVPWLGTFEEVNLRFYVKRREGNTIKRGVVFISETVPYKAVAYIANKLYREHYTAVKTTHSWRVADGIKDIEYKWLAAGKWNTIAVKASETSSDIYPGTFEQFIYEHYFGYTRINATTTEEYTVMHPVWKVNAVQSYDISCDFGSVYGAAFESLNDAAPHSVFLAEGSDVKVGWKRRNLT
jgi:uncharacterized protein